MYLNQGTTLVASTDSTDFDKPEPSISDSCQDYVIVIGIAGRQIDYYFIYGNNMDEVISGDRILTGKAPIVPKWALGFWCPEIVRLL